MWSKDFFTEGENMKVAEDEAAVKGGRHAQPGY